MSAKQLDVRVNNRCIPDKLHPALPSGMLHLIASESHLVRRGVESGDLVLSAAAVANVRFRHAAAAAATVVLANR